MSKRRKTRFGLFIMLAIFVYLACIFVDQQSLLYTKKQELNKIESKISDEEKLNKELNKELEMIQSDEYIEKVAREKLGMVKRDERIYVDIGK